MGRIQLDTIQVYLAALQSYYTDHAFNSDVFDSVHIKRLIDGPGKAGIGGQPAVEALEKDWGKEWRREGKVGRWFSARRPLIEKVYRWISQGCSAEAAVELVERERGSRSLDKFYKDYVLQKNGGVVVPRRGRAVAAGI
jgi:hypothetical protein